MQSSNERFANPPLQGAALALVPLAIALLLGAMMLPRSVPPDDIPLPEVDERALLRVERDEAALWSSFQRTGLPGDVRALGSDLRALHYLQATSTSQAPVTFEPAQEKVIAARAQAVATSGKDAVRMLFVVQSHAFLDAVLAFKTDGKETDAMRELAGPFLQRLRQAEWIVGHDVQLSVRELRVLYKLMWGLDTGLEALEGFAPNLDERRVLYGLYLRKPHPPEHLRNALLRAKEHAGNRELCAKVEDETRAASEKWRIGKISALGDFDTRYPTEYALGIAHFRLGDYQASVQSFRRWIDQHPSGAWTLRAQNHLKAAQQATHDMP